MNKLERIYINSPRVVSYFLALKVDDKGAGGGGRKKAIMINCLCCTRHTGTRIVF